MNTDPERDDGLLEAVLCDETWLAASAGFKAEAMRTLRTRQRVRRLARWAGGVAALMAVMAVMAHWMHWTGRPAASRRQMAMTRAAGPKAPDQPRYLTDAELIARFPRGSCFIAEVDGKKELVFLNPQLERTYVVRVGAKGN
jgi:hypothetical protein